MDLKATNAILEAFSSLAHAARVEFESLQAQRDNGAFLRADRKTRSNLHDASAFDTSLLASIQEFASKKIFAGSKNRPYFDGARDALSHALALRADSLADPFEKACSALASPDQVELAALSLGRAIEALSDMASGFFAVLRPDTGAPVLSSDLIEPNMVRCAFCFRGISHAWERNMRAEHHGHDNAVVDLANILRVLQSRSEDRSKFKRLDRASESFAQALASGSPAYLAALRTTYTRFGMGPCDVLEHALAMREASSIALSAQEAVPRSKPSSI